MRAANTTMLANLLVVVVALVGLLPSAASAPAVVSNSTTEYFTLMRAYLGEDGFARHPCLAEQEKHGWVSDNAHQLPMNVFTWGTEGVGHHAFETLLGPTKAAFATLKGNGGQHSVPSMWRHKQRVTKLGTHDNPDIAAQVANGNLLIFAIRYAPSSLLSAISRFQNTSSRKNNAHEKECNVYVSGCDELFTLHDSLAFIENVLRYPEFDCGRMIIVPYELLTQRPLALYGPLSQAMQLSQMGQAGYDLLATRLHAIEEYKLKQTNVTGGHHYDILEAMCTDLGISQTTKKKTKNERGGQMPPSTPCGPALLAFRASPWRTRDQLLQRPCADRLHTFAEAYFDERRYMFPGVYPSQTFIDASRTQQPGSGLHFDALPVA